MDFKTHISRMYFQILEKSKLSTINTIVRLRIKFYILTGVFGPMGMEVLQQVEQHIIQLGTDLAHCSVVRGPSDKFTVFLAA